MRGLVEYILEELSKQNKKQLNYMIKRNLINDENFKDIIKDIVIDTGDYNNWIITKTDKNKLEALFKSKGLGSDNFKGSPNILHDIIKIFDKYDIVPLLKIFINSKGLIDWETVKTSDNILTAIKDIYKQDTSSLFGKDQTTFLLIKDIINNNNNFDLLCNDLSMLSGYKAKKTSAAIGNYELMLRLFIIESCKNDKGDLYLNNNDIVEIKAGNSLNTSGRVAGQVPGLKAPSVITKKINYELGLEAKAFNSQSNTDYKIVPTYFGNSGTKKTQYQSYSPKTLIKNINISIKNGNEYSFDDIITIITESVLSQWEECKNYNKANITNLTTNLSGLYKEAIGYNEDENEFILKDSNILINIVGALQLYMYSLAEGFTYLYVSDFNHNYIILTEKDFANPYDVIKKCDFAPIGISDSTREYVCRIWLKK